MMLGNTLHPYLANDTLAAVPGLICIDQYHSVNCGRLIHILAASELYPYEIGQQQEVQPAMYRLAVSKRQIKKQKLVVTCKY